MLEFNFNWDKLSVSAGLTLRNFYFRLYPGAIGELEVIDFLKALVRHIDGPLLIVWDRLPAHRSRLVREFIQLSEDHIATEYLPPYAPELNPVEYIWAYWKQHELPNVCPKDYWELDERARKALRRMRRKPRLITAFWKQSSLCLDSQYIMRDSVEFLSAAFRLFQSRSTHAQCVGRDGEWGRYLGQAVMSFAAVY